MSFGARSLLVAGALFVTGCIKVPTAVKASFCAQPARKNHFGTGAAAGSCCTSPPHMIRFGSDTGACRR
ncbi:MAG TPA: hypothetical protein VMI54_13310 [Polyangiaceae bacterium]|nr:hypothetical protein [Polyangiaceae bacterium]